MKNKIKWYRRLYLDGEGNPEKLLKSLSDGRLHPGLYLLTLPSNRENLLDILPQPVLFQEHYQRIPLFVVGACRGRERAMELAGRIVLEAYRATGSTRVDSYLGDDYTDGPLSPEGPLYREW